MYYYIAEPTLTKAERRRIDDIKSLLSQLGIAGEFAVASPARTVEEHLELAFTKGFTTIVGIGSDALACRIAATMLERNYDRAAMGMIPLEPGQKMWEMLGVRSVHEIGELLRTRLLHSVDILQLGEKQAIVVPATISLSEPVRFQLQYKGATLLGKLTDVTVEPNGEVRLWDRRAQQPAGLWGRLFGGKKSSELAVTHLVANRWQLATERPVDVTVGGQVVAQTPLSVTVRPKALKLIVNRAIITPEKASATPKES